MYQDKLEEMKNRTENLAEGDTKQLMEKAIKSVEDGRKVRSKVRKHFTRGGAREGAGRPKKEKSERASNQVNFRITDSQLDRLSELAQEGESTNQAARRILLVALGED